jgi:hypothetical protein
MTAILCQSLEILHHSKIYGMKDNKIQCISTDIITGIFVNSHNKIVLKTENYGEYCSPFGVTPEAVAKTLIEEIDTNTNF